MIKVAINGFGGFRHLDSKMLLCYHKLMIRTTVRFEENLFKDARKKAIDEGVAFAKIINEALGEYLQGSRKKSLVKKIKFGAYHLGKIKGSLRRVDIYENI